MQGIQRRFYHGFPILFSILVAMASAQNRIGTGAPARLYEQHCLICHGENLDGGVGGSLVDAEWTYARTDAELAQLIKKGLPEAGMIAYESILSDEEIRSLVIYIREAAQLKEKEALETSLKPKDGVFSTRHHSFRLEELRVLDGRPWAIVFLPDGSKYITERSGELYHVDGNTLTRIRNLPRVRDQGQGGMLEVALHPDYEKTGWVYLAYAHADAAGGGMTRVVRGKVEQGRWTNEELIYAAPANTYINSNFHFGTRLVFKDGYVFIPIGDRGRQDMAQDLSKPNGKIHRVHEDGRLPVDNPFLDTPNALPTIWSYGHRNPQGLDIDPRNGDIWSTEHGPRGGDETNLIERGLNYGWPVVTHGINYNGTPITDLTEKEGMEPPVHQWTPSIAVCGIDFYEGERFPQWRHNLLVTGLASEELRRLVIEERKVVADEIILKNEGRVRDVVTGPDGLIYLLLETNGQGRLCRLVPAE